MTGQLTHRREMAPYLLNLPHIQPPFCYHCPFALSYPTCHLSCAEELAHTLEQENPSTIAAFIAEPIIGTTGGAIVPPPGYYEKIREICINYDILFIADEVITGFGRTGLNFGIEHWSAVPDIMTCSKALSSGYAPIGAVIIRDDIYQTFLKSQKDTISLRLTYSGHPVGCAAALAVQEYIRRHELIERCADMGIYLKNELQKLAERVQWIGDVRGKGLLIGVEFVQDRITRRPFPRSQHLQEQIVESALGMGLILVGGTGNGAGLDGDHILISPPFIIEKGECDEIVATLEASIYKVKKSFEILEQAPSIQNSAAILIYFFDQNWLLGWVGGPFSMVN